IVGTASTFLALRPPCARLPVPAAGAGTIAWHRDAGKGGQRAARQGSEPTTGGSRGAGSDEGGDPRSAAVSCHARRDLARRPPLEGASIPRDHAWQDPSALRNRIRKRGPRNLGTRHSFSTNLVTSLSHSR